MFEIKTVILSDVAKTKTNIMCFIKFSFYTKLNKSVREAAKKAFF